MKQEEFFSAKKYLEPPLHDLVRQQNDVRDESEFFRDDMPMLPYFVGDTKLITPKRHEITLEQIEKLKKKYFKFAEPLNIEKE